MTEDRNMEHDRHVYTHDADKGDDSGVAAIVRAFIKNPAGAVQIVLFIGGLYGLYYAMNTKIDDVRAAQLVNSEKFGARLEVLIASDVDQKAKIEAIYQRGDTRYSAIIAKLSAHDLDIAKIVTNLDFLVDQYKNHDAHDTEARPPRIKIEPLSPVP